MKLNELKNLVETGVATGLEITHYGASCTVCVCAGAGVSVLETAKGHVRRFKTIDAAFEICLELQTYNPYLNDKLPVQIVDY